MVGDVAPSRRYRRRPHGRPPLAVGVLAEQQPAGQEQPRGDVLDDPDRVEAVFARPQRERRVVVATSGATDSNSPIGMYGGLAVTTSTVPARSSTAVSAMSPSRTSTPRRPALRTAHACAESESSMATMRARPRLGRHGGCDRAGPGAEVDRQRRAAPLAGRSRSSSTAQPASSSVSGRGHEHPGADLELEVAEAGRSRARCCSGSRRGPTRRPGSSDRLVGVELRSLRRATRQQRPRRGRASTWASSDSASCARRLAHRPRRAGPRRRRAAAPAWGRAAHAALPRPRRAGRRCRRRRETSITASRSPSSTWSRL